MTMLRFARFNRSSGTILVGALLASCGGGMAVGPQSPAGGAQSSTSISRLHTEYKLIDTGTLGGPIDSLGFEGERDLNNDGKLVELADLAMRTPPQFCFSTDPPQHCHVAHAALWSERELDDLGSLVRGYSGGPQWISDRGQVAGLAQTGRLDPLTNFMQFHAVQYTGDRVFDLGTLGGYESAGFGLNDAGRISGCATTKKSDPYGFCFTAQVSRAVLWSDGKIRDLGTLGGPDAFAELVNDRGDVAGWSLTDYKVNPQTGIPTQHPFLWRDGKMRDLGTIGGTAVPLVNDLNERGEFVGSMNVTGDQSFHPFLWNGTVLKDLGTLGGAYGQADWISDAGSVVGWAVNAQSSVHAFFWNGAMHDIGILAGDKCSVAYGVNSRGQATGVSYPDAACSELGSSHAFLYERGDIVDLNQLVDSSRRVQLTVALTINERGEIAAQGVFPNGDIHGFLLVPTGREVAPRRSASTFKVPASLALLHGYGNSPVAMIAAFREHHYYSRFSKWR